MSPATYAIALGSNRRHGRHGAPAAVLRAALVALDKQGIEVTRRSRVVETAALGPAGRRFANAAALVETTLDPPALLRRLKAVERCFGRRRGRRWGPRVLDLDLLLWSGGTWRSRSLAVPHPALAARDFVLAPLGEIAPRWRVPGTGRTVAQLRVRLLRRLPVDRAGSRA